MSRTVRTWQTLYNQHKEKGVSDSLAYKWASEEMQRRRSLFKPEDHIIGLSEVDAANLMDANGYSLRVVWREGVGQNLNLDYRPTRYNVIVKDGKVTGIDPKWKIG